MREAKDGSPYRVMVVTLGCAKNRVDSEVMLAQLAQAGYLITDDPQTADVVIFNTCGFIEAAKRESLAAVLEAAERKTEAKKLILDGCLAQGHGRELAAELPEVDAIVGPGMAGRMATVVREVLAGKRVLALGSRGEWEALPLPRLLTTFPGTAYLKIAEGCNH
ncbi:MAG: 30S ribosomal protein S12 methylthiotransferase RimO, partial [Clostridia bacterium]|nr:30S ribosomal protein S12 methylthiotransferase RimO [Clostridia bacterium]